VAMRIYIKFFIGYEAPAEYGKDISTLTIVVNSVGLILIAVVSITKSNL